MKPHDKLYTAGEEKRIYIMVVISIMMLILRDSLELFGKERKAKCFVHCVNEKCARDINRCSQPMLLPPLFVHKLTIVVINVVFK